MIALLTESIEDRIKTLFDRASSTILANITIDKIGNLDEFEVYPSRIPDLLFESPLIVSGRYKGAFPDNIKARGILADTSNFVVDLKVQEAEDIPLDKVLVTQEINLLTALAWFSENKDLEEKVAKMSVRHGVVSEYTSVAWLETQELTKTTADAVKKVKGKSDRQKTEDSKDPKITVLGSFGIGFGNLTATAENISPSPGSEKLPETAVIFVKVGSNCCGWLCSHCFCPCCIQTCSQLNNSCAVALTQLCGALGCMACFSCCEECCSCFDQ